MNSAFDEVEDLVEVRVALPLTPPGDATVKIFAIILSNY